MKNFLDSNERYEIIDILGTGSFGVVYKVYDSIDRKVKAIKKLLVQSGLDDEEQTKKIDDFQSELKELINPFIEESQIGRELNHLNNIVKIEYIEVDKKKNLIFIIMEYLGETSLKKWLDDNQIEKRDLNQVYQFMKEALEIFVELHKYLIHRDIKPSNIMVKDNKLIITDLGLSKIIKENDTISLDKEHSFIPVYKAPEELKSSNNIEVDVRTDIYSLGVVFYKLLTDELPLYKSDMNENIILDTLIESNSITKLKTSGEARSYLTSLQKCENEHKRVKPPSKVNPKILHLFDDFVLKMFKCNKDYRFQSMQEALNEFESIMIRLDGFELIEAGEFIKDEGEDAKNTFVNNFYISKHPITNKQYIEFLEDIDSNEIDKFKKLSKNLPVVNITWDEAIKYCKWRSKKENKKFRLPKVKEWEKVCKNRENYKYSWGDSEIEINDSKELLNIYAEIFKDEIEDKNYQVLGMSGNIWEWCLDSYSQDDTKMLKGGAFNSNTFEKRCSFPYYAKKNTKRDNRGFRVVIEI